MAPLQIVLPKPLACFYAATLAWNPTAVDTGHLQTVLDGDGQIHNDEDDLVRVMDEWETSLCRQPRLIASGVAPICCFQRAESGSGAKAMPRCSSLLNRSLSDPTHKPVGVARSTLPPIWARFGGFQDRAFPLPLLGSIAPIP